MVRERKRPLKVFLCHASGDKPPVRDLYKRLTAEGVDAWLDKEKLLPGQDWHLEIPKAVREADVVVVCLSKRSITKEGYVQKEIKFALDIAEEKPEGTIFLIPARLEDCTVPDRLNRWQWVDLYEDDGFIKLLRSLKLRADAVSATVEPALYVDSEKETDRRLEQLYTEGLAAFYTEDWNRACRCFQSILSERPNHKHAAEKLEEAETQRNLSTMYEQALVAHRSEDWEIAIQILEELSARSADYKDAAQLLRDDRKRKQLRDLYAEAKALHVGKQWEAVVKVFKQISVIEPNYPDADELLPSAQKEVTELKRIADLNDQYSQSLREMEAGNWYEARKLLESVHKSETGFLETEKLLRKVEKEISKEEERRKQNDQVNTLYEQAHGLLRSKKWRNALDKMDDIRKLDEHFPDADRIAEKAKRELAREEQEAERQNTLAALYAEAVKLLKEEKYQEALDKWGEVKAIDPKYPDRQRVARTAKRKLGGKPAPTIASKQKITFGNLAVGWLIFLAAVGFGLARLVELNLAGMFRVDLPGELTWGVAGALQGLIAALVMGMVEKEWRWKSLPIFGVCWAVGYSIVLWTLREGATLLIVSIAFSLAPVVSVVLSSLWTRQVRHWLTYVLIFFVWILVWAIGLRLAEYINPVLHGSSLRWVFRDILAGGIGLWITVDRLGRKTVGDEIETDTNSTPGSAWLLVWAFLGFVILRLLLDVFGGWLHIWDVPIPTVIQVIFIFLLGACFGVVVAFSLKTVSPGWKWHHSLMVIAGWALGFDVAFLALPKNINFDAILMAISGLTLIVGLKLVKPSLSPLKLTLVFVSWVLAKTYGATMAGYLEVNLHTNFNWLGDPISVLLGLLATLGIYEYSSIRLVKITLLSVIGFALGNLATSAVWDLLALDSQIKTPLVLPIWGFVAGVVFEIPSRNLKKMLIRGGLCALGLLIGYFAAQLFLSRFIDLKNILWGLGTGIALSLPSRRLSVITLLAILGSAIFMMTTGSVSGIDTATLWGNAVRGAWIGLVLGFGYAYATRDLENNKEVV